MFNQYFGNPFYSNSNYQNNSNASKNNMNMITYPLVINIDKETLENRKFVTNLWSGEDLQISLMCVNPGERVGLKISNEAEKVLRIEEGFGVCIMGRTKNNLNFRKNVYDGYAIVIPKNIWFDVINLGNKPMKVYSICSLKKTIHNKTVDMKKTKD